MPMCCVALETTWESEQPEDHKKLKVVRRLSLLQIAALEMDSVGEPCHHPISFHKLYFICLLPFL